MIRFVLPFPPSVNKLWRHVTIKGRKCTLLSADGRQYKTDVATLVTIARSNGEAPRAPLSGRVRYSLTLFPPDRRRRDISNSLKVVEDALTTAGVWTDDEIVDEFHVKRGPVVKGGRAVIEIEAMG